MLTTTNRRALLLGVCIVLAGALAGAASAGGQTRQTRIGESYEFLLDGNPSTGYTWQLEKEQSSGLDVVEVTSLGYTGQAEGTQVLGAPEKFAFRIKSLKAGDAHLVFGYHPPGGGPATETHETWLHVNAD